MLEESYDFMPLLFEILEVAVLSFVEIFKELGCVGKVIR
jgi:hypothetical protein